jgi:hypothetical protein
MTNGKFRFSLLLGCERGCEHRQDACPTDPQTRQCPTGLIVGRVGREPESSEFYLSLEAVLKFTVVAVENHCVWTLLWPHPQVSEGDQYSLPYSVFK